MEIRFIKIHRLTLTNYTTSAKVMSTNQMIFSPCFLLCKWSMPNARPAVTPATCPWRLAACEANKRADWLWCVHGLRLERGEGCTGGQRVALKNPAPAGMTCLQFLGNWVTATATHLPSIREWGYSTKMCFSSSETARVLLYQIRQTHPDNSAALVVYINAQPRSTGSGRGDLWPGTCS